MPINAYKMVSDNRDIQKSASNIEVITALTS